MNYWPEILVICLTIFIVGMFIDGTLTKILRELERQNKEIK